MSRVSIMQDIPAQLCWEYLHGNMSRASKREIRNIIIIAIPNRLQVKYMVREIAYRTGYANSWFVTKMSEVTYKKKKQWIRNLIQEEIAERNKMSRDKQTEIQQFAIDLQNVSAKVSNMLMEETHEFLSQKHKYKSLKDFHEAHPKSRCQMEAEFLTELGYSKASEIIGEIIKDLVNFADDNEKQMLINGHSVWFINADDVTEFIAELKKKYESEKDNGKV